MRRHPGSTPSSVRRLTCLLATGLLAVAVTVSLAPSASAGAGGAAERSAEAASARYLDGLWSPQASLPLRKCAAAADRAGFAATDLTVATAVSMGESTCNPKASSSNPPTEGCPDGSRDRGIFQINSCYHSEVSDACAFQLQCNADAAYDIYLEASGFSPWTVYRLRLFKSYLNESRKAVKKVTGDNIAVGVIMTEAGGPLNVRNKPRTSGDIVGQLADNAVVRIKCQTRGESIYSPIFDYETRIWDSDGPGRYYSDGYVYTDSRKRVAPGC